MFFSLAQRFRAPFEGAAIMQGPPAGSHPSNLPFPKEGFRPLLNPRQSCGKDLIDFEQKPLYIKVLVSFTKLSPYG